jgi:hypothetical protein
MVNMSYKLKERNILKLILIVRFACAILDVGHPIRTAVNNWPTTQWFLRILGENGSNCRNDQNQWFILWNRKHVRNLIHSLKHGCKNWENSENVWELINPYHHMRQPWDSVFIQLQDDRKVPQTVTNDRVSNSFFPPSLWGKSGPGIDPNITHRSIPLSDPSTGEPR